MSTSSRLVILSCSVGSGHARAASALAAWAAELYPGLAVETRDILEFTSGVYRRAYRGSYLALADHAPALWGLMYDTSDRGRVHKRAPLAVRAYDRLEFAGFRKWLRQQQPTAVLCTHFLPVQVLAHVRGRQAWAGFPLHLVVTDYYAHLFWAQPGADAIYVANDESVEEMADRGVKRGVQATGIPIVPPFARPMQRSAARAKAGLDDRPVVLLMGGGWGNAGMEKLAEAVLSQGPVQVVAVAGRNPRMQQELAALKVPRHSALKVLGFVDYIHELMAAADLCVSKSGGLTTAECLAMGLPMLVPNPIPGQEERNADYLAEIGAGFKARTPGVLRQKLKRLLADADLRARMSAAARAHGRPQAAAEILRRVLPSP
ncbi:MAG: glycosyltransferase [Planctomycetes bacterium]|nr:glycosyltransferase [Planctomycetota bacterium]